MTQELASANEATKPVSASEYTPNRYFFLQPVIFQVDNELFQIPDTLFPASETFKKLYPAILEGNTPVVLRDCTKRQFEAFLIIVLQPHSHMFNGKHPCNYPPLLEFLLPAFELAKKWGFQQLAMDIGHQAGLLMSSPVQKVAVGHRYAVLPWYRSGLEELVTSDDDITLEDAGEIGFPLALRLYHARARYGRSMRDRRHEEHGTVASGIVESMFAEDLAIFPASRSEVIQNEDQLHQVEQADETETETVIVTAGDAEGFEMIARDQGSSDTETEDSESRKGTDDAEKAIESVDECAEVQQEKPNTEGALSENPASSLVEPTSQATTESEPACATRRSNEDAKPDSRRESPILHVPSSSSGVSYPATTIALQPEMNTAVSSGNETIRQILRAIINPTWRSSTRAATLVPRRNDCNKKRCRGGLTTCMSCCQSKARECLGNSPNARTTLAQACLRHILQNAGLPSSSSEILRGVPIACSAKAKLCGANQRCWNCIGKEAEKLIQKGDMI